MNNVQRWRAVFHRPGYSCFILLLLGSQLLWEFLRAAYDPVSTTQTLSKTLAATQRGAMTEILESKPFGSQFTNVYLSIFALFCFKLFVKISLNILTHFYVVKGNRKEAARIAAEFYDFGQGHRSWADRSPLHEAASQGRLLALRTLLSQGYSANILTIDHVTPLHEACLGDHVACARALINAGANVNATTIDGVTPLFNACSAGSVTCTEVLLERGAKPQSEICQPSPIHEATSKGRSACVEALIAWGADVDYDIPHLGTPLYIACMSKELQCTHVLLEGGANVQKGRFLETPLHAAAQKDCPEVMKALLEFGANINSKNLELKRPVETAPPSSLAEGLLLLYEATPRSLCQLCRLSIREYVGRSRLHLIPQLQLPTLLKRFLQYR
ncbi:ankyrin repeat and SOCS box protein 5b isoform X1 [Anguilla rostrata]|uniref:ankyrin repeat and SOCS box protein 5b isoform X1 n=1 Tax=Anguilla anguilla TaxID=7936 RepID=UPI0015ADF9F9|nr:ankyrin repeat and SOCS box protein 5b isoform X1 [Anguilla anguilla]